MRHMKEVKSMMINERLNKIDKIIFEIEKDLDSDAESLDYEAEI